MGKRELVAFVVGADRAGGDPFPAAAGSTSASIWLVAMAAAVRARRSCAAARTRAPACRAWWPSALALPALWWRRHRRGRRVSLAAIVAACCPPSTCSAGTRSTGAGRRHRRLGLHGRLLPRRRPAPWASCAPPFDPALGWKIVFFHCLTVWAGDSGAYYVGSRFGRHRLAPRGEPEEVVGGVRRRRGADVLRRVVLPHRLLPRARLARRLAALAPLLIAAGAGRRPRRVAVQARRRGQGLLGADPGPRRVPRPHRLAVLRRPVRPRALPARSGSRREAPGPPRLHRLDRHRHARRGGALPRALRGGRAGRRPQPRRCSREQARAFRPAPGRGRRRGRTPARLAARAARASRCCTGEAGRDRGGDATRTPTTVVGAFVGALGLVPTWRAIELGRDVLLANKETLVVAGELVMAAAARHRRRDPADRLRAQRAPPGAAGRRHRARCGGSILTASGGPFRTRPAAAARARHRGARRSPTRPGGWAPRSPSTPPR